MHKNRENDLYVYVKTEKTKMWKHKCERKWNGNTALDIYV